MMSSQVTSNKNLGEILSGIFSIYESQEYSQLSRSVLIDVIESKLMEYLTSPTDKNALKHLEFKNGTWWIDVSIYLSDKILSVDLIESVVAYYIELGFSIKYSYKPITSPGKFKISFKLNKAIENLTLANNESAVLEQDNSNVESELVEKDGENAQV